VEEGESAQLMARESFYYVLFVWIYEIFGLDNRFGVDPAVGSLRPSGSARAYSSAVRRF
jgi:hypothetical protein